MLGSLRPKRIDRICKRCWTIANSLTTNTEWRRSIPAPNSKKSMPHERATFFLDWTDRDTFEVPLESVPSLNRLRGRIGGLARRAFGHVRQEQRSREFADCEFLAFERSEKVRRRRGWIQVPVRKRTHVRQIPRSRSSRRCPLWDWNEQRRRFGFATVPTDLDRGAERNNVAVGSNDRELPLSVCLVRRRTTLPGGSRSSFGFNSA